MRNVYVNKFRYDVVEYELNIPLGNKTITKKMEPKNVIGISIEKLYDTHTLPVMRLTTLITMEDYSNILKSKMMSTVRLRVDRFMDTKTASPFKHRWIDDKFLIVTDDLNPFIEGSLNQFDQGKLVSKYQQNEIIQMDLYLFKYDDIISANTYVSTVISAANMTTAVSYLLTQASIGKILMSRLDNNTVYRDILIPPGTMVSAIRYLHEYYGLYMHGMQLFFDYDMKYLINKSSKCTAYERGELKDIIIKIQHEDNPFKINEGSFNDIKNKTHYIAVRRANAHFKDDSIMEKQTVGSTLLVTSGVSGNTYTNKTGKNAISNKVTTLESSNPFSGIEYQKRTDERAFTLNISMTNVDLSILRPNKRYIMDFEETKLQRIYGGDYRISMLTTILKREGDNFSPIVSGTFYKID